MSTDITGPAQFGRYTLMRRIGQGGMGEVFLARENNAGNIRAVVVKKVLPTLLENPQFVGRFLDEAKVVVRLAHPNIARVYSMGEVDGNYYLAMEYVQGKTVSRFMHRLRQRREQLSLGHILLIGERICEGLAYAHEAKDETGQPLLLVHRDLSPANVCVGYRGEVKIIDFGAAQSRLKEQQTAPRIVIGNLTYMSPEQARKMPVDQRADIYGTGAVLWELLAWNPLPQKGDPVERWKRAANPAWSPPSRVNARIPHEVDGAILRALQREPKQRYPDGRAFRDELAALRRRFGQGENDRTLGELLSDAFSREKEAEDLSLGDILHGIPDAEMPTMVQMEVVVPPTALAFEHSAVSGMEEIEGGGEGDEVTDPGAEQTPIRPPRARTLTHSRVAFGAAQLRGPAEASLLREIEGEQLPDSTLLDAGRLLTADKQVFWVLGMGAFLAALILGFAAVVLFAPR